MDETDATVSDLNETKYGNKTDGYKFTEGTGTLFASVTGSKNKTLEWSKDGDDAVAAEYTMGDATEAEPVMAATSKNPWTADTTPYFEIVTSTNGYKTANFSAYIGASKKGTTKITAKYSGKKAVCKITVK